MIEESPFERLRKACLEVPQAAKELLPLIDFWDAFPEQVGEEALIHLVGVTALGIAKTPQGGIWNRTWLFQRGAPPADPLKPGLGWLVVPWSYLGKTFGHLVLKSPGPIPGLEMLLSVSAPLLAWRRLETHRIEQNRALALQFGRLNTLFDLSRSLDAEEANSKKDVMRHFANTLAGEFMILRLLALDPNGAVLVGRGLGELPDALGEEDVQRLAEAKGLSLLAEMSDKGQGHGAVYASTPKGRLSEEDEVFLQTLINITSAHLTAIDLRESRIQAVKHEKDMELARNIQRRLLPHRLPEPMGWQCAAANLPFEAVGGDYYDLWVAKDPDRGDRLHLFAGDVSGKGLPAALMMMQISAFLRATADRRVNDWGYMARRLNARMNEVRDRNRYTTLFAASLNPKNGDMRYINGGHNPPILIPAAGGLCRHLEPTGPIVGLIHDVDFVEGHETMAQGDVLVAFTDGLVEAENQMGEEFGENNVAAAAMAAIHGSAADIFERILVKVFSFVKQNGFKDDATLLVIKRASGTGN
jgi:sigma-B regulation protein RsbU (phosphoserine phosphatase)